MSLAIDYYLGRGPAARWLGSMRLHGCPGCTPHTPLASCPTGYQLAVATLLTDAQHHHYGQPHHHAEGWPWIWPTSHGSDLVYAYHQNRIWVSERGRAWQPAHPTNPAQPPPADHANPAPGYPLMRPRCPITGIHASQTVHRYYGRWFTDTAHLDLPQLAVRIHADLTTPTHHPYTTLPTGLRYTITPDPDTTTLHLQVSGLTDPDPDTTDTLTALQSLATDYGWADLHGGPARFDTRITLTNPAQHASRNAPGPSRRIR